MASTIVIAGFDEIRLTKKLEFGFEGGPEWSTTVAVTAAGYEQRNQNWENPRRTYSAEFRQLPGDPFNDFDDLLDFWNSRRGRLRGFRFRDHFDDTATTEVCTLFNDTTALVGDGVETEFQCAKLYDDGVNPYRRLIKKPAIESGAQADADDAAATVFLDTGGGPVLQDRNPAGDYDLDTTSGKITFNVAPPAAAIVTWTGTFDVPVRFEGDRFPAVNESFDSFVVPLDVVEIRIPQV